MKKILLILVTIGLCLYTHSLQSEEIPGASLLNAFSSQCRNQGEWVRSALSDSNALMGTLKAMANDPDCRTVSGALSDLSSLQTTIQNYQNIESVHVEIAQLEAQEQMLLNFLSKTTDSTVIAEINSNLRSILTQKASMIVKQNTANANSKQAAVLGVMVSQTNSALKQIVSNQACLLKRPNGLATAFSLGASVSAQALSSANPALGLGLAAGSDLMAIVIEMASRMKLNRKLKKFAASTTAIEAYKCALESMSERWCLMQDAEKFIELKTKLQFKAADSKLLYSLVMNDRDIPVLLGWLENIRNGVPPSSTADAGRLQEVHHREATVKSTLAMAQGLFAQQRPLFVQSPTPEDKWTVIRSTIVNLLELNAREMGHDFNPFYEIYSKEQGAYYLLGLTSIPNRGNIPIPFQSFNPFNSDDYPPGNFKPDYEKMVSQFNIWGAKAQDRINRELSLVLQPDGLRTVISAFDQTDGHIKLSPREALVNIISFLKESTPQNWNGSTFRRVYEDQIKRMEKILQLVDEVANDQNTDPKKALEIIYEQAYLQFNITVFKGRLEMIVRLAIQEAIRKAEIKDQNIVAQFLAAHRFTDTLSRNSSAEDLSSVMADIRRARPLVLANLTNFSNLFEKNIESSLQKLQELESQADSSIAGDFAYSRAELCYALLAVPQWPKDISPSYCLGISIKPLIPGGPSSMPITQKLIATPYVQRACTHRDFLRASTVFQQWGIKL